MSRRVQPDTQPDSDLQGRQEQQERDPAEDAYSVDYLRDVADGDAREERLAELRRRIQLGAYHVDPNWIADHFLSRDQNDPPEDS